MNEGIHIYNGIINVLKPPGMTSFDVVAYLRGVLKTRKIGHTGTLDPAAVGVLPICVGSATKVIEFITDKDKHYRAELTLGIRTDTQDSSGNIIDVRNPDISEEKIRSTIKSFEGKYSQIPPMYSAVKVDGKKLYELARSGITIERKPREVEIYSADILKIESGIAVLEDNGIPVIRVLFDIKCSKGTYIRTLCDDIGERLGCGGHMSFLIRLGTGAFGINDSKTLDEIKAMIENNEPTGLFTDIVKTFDDLGEIKLKISEEKRFVNGIQIQLINQDAEKQRMVRVLNSAGKFIALGEIIEKEGIPFLKSKKFFQ
ncbi:MAG TPA: tRNA pseudouridine(55) synthase TruB [Clostridia bacterium]|nr:tRNA pseudouridine(55) synthase TruB [Clostridia bacterium]